MISCVQKSLALYLYDDARFWAERLVAQFPKEVGLQTAVFKSYHRRLRYCLCPTKLQESVTKSRLRFLCPSESEIPGWSFFWNCSHSAAAHVRKGQQNTAVLCIQGNLLLQATCYFRSDQAYRAYHLLLGEGHAATRLCMQRAETAACTSGCCERLVGLPLQATSTRPDLVSWCVQASAQSRAVGTCWHSAA